MSGLKLAKTKQKQTYQLFTLKLEGYFYTCKLNIRLLDLLNLATLPQKVPSDLRRRGCKESGMLGNIVAAVRSSQAPLCKTLRTAVLRCKCEDSPWCNSGLAQCTKHAIQKRQVAPYPRWLLLASVEGYMTFNGATIAPFIEGFFFQNLYFFFKLFKL